MTNFGRCVPYALAALFLILRGLLDCCPPALSVALLEICVVFSALIASLKFASGSALREERVLLLIPLLAGASLICLLWQHYGGLYLASDDSYIYLGYVRSIRRGIFEGLFSYNLGEHSGGTTGILYYYSLLISYLFLDGLFGAFFEVSALLIFTTYFVNILCLLIFFILIKKILAIHITRNPQKVLALSILCIVLSFSSEALRWGFWCGLEGPLMVVILTALTYVTEKAFVTADGFRSLTASSHYYLLLICAAFTRPEYAPLCAAAILVGIFYCAAQDSKRAFRLLLNSAGLISLLAAPLLLSTGSLIPSAEGSRVSASLTFDGSFKNIAEFVSSGWLMVPLILMPLAAYCRSYGVLFMGCFCVAMFLDRALFGLANLGVMDRYVSYMFPVYVCLIFTLMQRVLAKGDQNANGKCLNYIISICGVSAVLVVGLLSFLTIEPAVTEMNTAVVEPSRWIAANIPKEKKICMEPAGALRLFTDNYLIDVVGLTTKHVLQNKEPLGQLIASLGADYCFVYPFMIERWNVESKAIKIWPVDKAFSLGNIGFYEIKKNSN